MKLSLLALAPLLTAAVKESSPQTRGLTQKSKNKSPKSSDDGCGPEAMNGVYRYMATTGVNGGKAYTVIVNYDANTADQEGLFVLFADGLPGEFLTMSDDDSVFGRFTEDNFGIDAATGACKFDLGVDLKCPFKGSAGTEDDEPDCGFSLQGTQIDENTWSLDFPPFPTGAPRLMTRN